MKLRSIVVVLALLPVVACAEPEPPDADGTWVGTITTQGNVTTVINESGSVWGGTAMLIEEASIGVEIGPDEYMFGRVGAVYATDDFIYVLDPQVPALRVYDDDGDFVRNLGGQGQGPGEFTSPSLLTADDAGRVYLLDSQLRRINVYGPAGEILDPWEFPEPRCCVWPMYPLSGEAVWAPVQEWLEDRSGRRYGIQAVGPNGAYGRSPGFPNLSTNRQRFRSKELSTTWRHSAPG